MSRKRRSGTASSRPPLVPAGPIPEWVACAWLQHFTIYAERARDPDLARRPVVLLSSGARGREEVLQACSPEALAAGLAPGMPVSSLAQRCPGAVSLPFDAPHYRRRFEAVLRAFDALTPSIEAAPFEVCYLDLTRLPHLCAEEPERVQAAVRAAVPSPFAVRLGIATGKFTALVAATRAAPRRPLLVYEAEKREFLRDAPAALLPADAETQRQLHLMGLRTLGRIAELRRSAMLSRFGWLGEHLHRLACGEDREPLTLHQDFPVIREEWRFAAPPTAIVFCLALEQLVRRVWARRERGGRGVRAVRLEARLESGAGWERSLTLRQPREQPEPAAAELKRRLEGDLPAGPVLELALELASLAPRVEGQQLLFQEEQVERHQRLQRELAQVETRRRLRGRAPVYRIVEVDPWSRFPEGLYGLVRFDP